MDIRNINRVFAFNKALNSFNKSTPLTGYEFNCLVALYHLQDPTSKGVTLLNIFNHLSSFYRTMALKAIQDTFIKLSLRGLVVITGKFPTLYCLTIEGKNTILSLEHKIRNTRYDK
jgi:hypothetical protein